MKRGKDEGTTMGPMFPRLHVNDTEKGGPRAPPRNKMALYEQLSIPSQRFSTSVLPLNQNMANNSCVNLVPNSVQGGGNEEGMFYPHQLPPKHLSEKQCDQYSDQSSQLTQVVQRKKSDEDEFRVPIFIHSFPYQECVRYNSDMEREKLSFSNPSDFNHSLKFQKAKDSTILEQSKRKKPKIQKGENSKEFLACYVKTIPTFIEKTEVLKKQTDSSASRAREENTANSTNKLKADESIRQEMCAESQAPSHRHIGSVLTEKKAAIDKRNSNSVWSLPLAEQDTSDDLSNDAKSQEDESCRSLLIDNFERGDSVSETSILESRAGPAHDITPDDVVGIIGQKHFWKARRAIANQQRLFAVQVFELHRLIKVQRLIAASPHLLLEDSSYLTKQVKTSPREKLPLNYAVKAIPNISKQNGDSDKPSRKEEGTAENTIEKPPFPSSKNEGPPSTGRTPSSSSPAPSMSSDYISAWPFNSQYGHQWLIPVMSPSEGLVYKPYLGPGFMPLGCGPPPGPNHFSASAYVPAPPHPQCQLPAFPTYGYFPPPCGILNMNNTAFSSSSVEQTPGARGQISAGEANYSTNNQNSFSTLNKKNGALPLNLHISNDVEVQGSTTSSPAHKSESVGGGMDGRSMLPLFPTSPVINGPRSCPQPPVPEHEGRVIKVMPRNGRSASESAARIFQSIQEERKQYVSCPSSHPLV